MHFDPILHCGRVSNAISWFIQCLSLIDSEKVYNIIYLLFECTFCNSQIPVSLLTCFLPTITVTLTIHSSQTFEHTEHLFKKKSRSINNISGFLFFIFLFNAHLSNATIKVYLANGSKMISYILYTRIIQYI
jgi:hypothetical protein